MAKTVSDNSAECKNVTTHYKNRKNARLKTMTTTIEGKTYEVTYPKNMIKCVRNKKDPLISVKNQRVVINMADPNSYIFTDAENNEEAVRREMMKALMRAAPEKAGWTEEQIEEEYQKSASLSRNK